MSTKSIHKLSREWILQTRADFRSFLDETKFPDPERMGSRGPSFHFPEWLIMFIAILAVKAKVKSYVGIHRLVGEYWNVISKGLRLKKISERQLRDRLKKIGHESGRTPGFILQLFSELVEAKDRKRR